MTEPNELNSLAADLMAFADGELDAAGEMRLLREVAADPRLVEQIARHKQVRQAVARSAAGRSPSASTDLRASIAQMFDRELGPAATPADEAGLQFGATPVTVPHIREPGSQSVLASIGKWIPAAVAALLFISTIIVVSNSEQLPARTLGIPVAKINEFEGRHWRCSREREKMMQDATIAQVVDADELPETVARLTGAASNAQFDLSSIGYEFWKAGNCHIPGDHAVHLIYKSKDGADALSLWLVKDDGQLPNVKEGQVYVLTPDRAPHPLLVWRSGEMIYYLAGDEPTDQIKQAAGAILVASG